MVGADHDILNIAGAKPVYAVAEVLIDLRRIARPGCALFIVSDFRGALAPRAMENLYQLSRHTEITAIHVSDPLEMELPRSGRYTVTDGHSRSRLYTADRQLREEFSERYTARLQGLLVEYGKLGIPVIQSQTGDSPARKLFTYYGEPARGGRRRAS